MKRCYFKVPYYMKQFQQNISKKDLCAQTLHILETTKRKPGVTMFFTFYSSFFSAT